MNPSISACLILLIVIILMLRRAQEEFMLIRRKKRARKGNVDMNELVQQFLGKNCYIYLGTSGGSVLGVVEKIEGNWVSLQVGESTELVNLDYICRIKEKPNKKAKK